MPAATPSPNPTSLLPVGCFAGVYGVRGWLKVCSYTEPMDNLLRYKRHYVQYQQNWQPLVLAEGKQHSKGLVVRIEGIDDNDSAQAYTRCEIAVPLDTLPPLPAGEFYWHQLIGLTVISVAQNTITHNMERHLGTVQRMLETGANDVLVVKGNVHSIDRRERLIPYLFDQVIVAVDREQGIIRVDWDPDF